MARTRSLRTQWARHRVDHGTICGRGYANSGHHKPLCACVDNTFINPNSSGRRPENLEFAPRPGKIAMSWLTCSTRCGTSTARKVEGPLRDALRHEQSADGNPAPLTLRSAASIRTHANRDNMRLLCRMQRTYGHSPVGPPGQNRDPPKVLASDEGAANSSRWSAARRRDTCGIC
jgi:hypothetical protein